MIIITIINLIYLFKIIFLTAAKAKKQAKLMQAAFSPAIISEREQLAAIAAITPCTTTNDPLNMSNSSQGSLTALQPQK